MTKDSDNNPPVRQHRTNSKPMGKGPKKRKPVEKKPIVVEAPVESIPPKPKRARKEPSSGEYDEAKLEIFLDFLRESGSIEDSCAKAKINSRTLRRWRSYGRDPDHPEYEVFKGLDPKVQAAKQCFLQYSCPDTMDTRIAIARRKLDLIQNGATETSTTVNLLIGYAALDPERGVGINENGEIDWNTVKVSWVNRNEKTVVVKRPVSATILAPDRDKQDLTEALKVLGDLNLISPRVNDEVSQFFEAGVIPKLRTIIGRGLNVLPPSEDLESDTEDNDANDIKFDFGVDDEAGEGDE